MNNNQIEGIGRQVKGALKEAAGKLMGDLKLQHDGVAEREAGEIQSAIDSGPVQVAGVDTDRVMGIGHQLKGKLTESIGRLFDNPALEEDGRAEQAAGRVQNAAGSARDTAIEAGRLPVEDGQMPIEIDHVSVVNKRADSGQ